MGSMAQISSFPDTSFKCEWPSCAMLRFEKYDEWTTHQESHYFALSSGAEQSGVLTCRWPNCRAGRSSKTFGTLSILRKHMLTHVNRFCCSQQGCNITFTRASDLARHMSTKHDNTRYFYCPHVPCERNVRGFSRRDKLDEHIRKSHLFDSPLPKFALAAPQQQSFSSTNSAVLHDLKRHAILPIGEPARDELAMIPSSHKSGSTIIENYQTTSTDTETSSDGSNPDSSHEPSEYSVDEEPVLLSPNEQKLSLVNRLMVHFYLLFKLQISAGKQNNATDAEEGLRSSTSNGQSSNTIETSGSRLTTNGKRGCEDNVDKRFESDDDDGGSQKRKRPRAQAKDKELSVEDANLACPYYNRNPHKYHSMTSCPGPGWKTVHRMK